MNTGRWKVMAVIATVAVRPLARRVATVPPARSICDSSQPPKISPCGLASAGMAMARNAGSIWGGWADVSVAGVGASVISDGFPRSQDRTSLLKGLGPLASAVEY